MGSGVLGGLVGMLVGCWLGFGLLLVVGFGMRRQVFGGLVGVGTCVVVGTWCLVFVRFGDLVVVGTWCLVLVGFVVVDFWLLGC